MNYVGMPQINIGIATGLGDDGRSWRDKEVEEKIAALPWVEVESSNILGLAFAPTESFDLDRGESLAVGWLWVEFKSGSVYAYKGVPMILYLALCRAKSVGKMHAALINGRYEYAGRPAL